MNRSLIELAVTVASFHRWSRGALDLRELAAFVERLAPLVRPSLWSALLELLAHDGPAAFRVRTDAPDLSPR